MQTRLRRLIAFPLLRDSATIRAQVGPPPTPQPEVREEGALTPTVIDTEDEWQRLSPLFDEFICAPDAQPATTTSDAAPIAGPQIQGERRPHGGVAELPAEPGHQSPRPPKKQRLAHAPDAEQHPTTSSPRRSCPRDFQDPVEVDAGGNVVGGGCQILRGGFFHRKGAWCGPLQQIHLESPPPVDHQQHLHRRLAEHRSVEVPSRVDGEFGWTDAELPDVEMRHIKLTKCYDKEWKKTHPRRGSFRSHGLNSPMHIGGRWGITRGDCARIEHGEGAPEDAEQVRRLSRLHGNETFCAWRMRQFGV